MIKEKINMELRAHILLIISISSLILCLSVEGLNILPSIAQPSSKLDKGNQLEKDQGSPVLDEPKKASKRPLGPVSPTPLDEAKQAFSLIADETEDQKSPSPASSPVSDQDKGSPKLPSLWGGISGVLDEAEKTFAPVTSSIVNEAEAVSSSIFGSGIDVSSPVPSSFSGRVPNPNSPHSSPDSGPAPSPFSGPVPHPNSPPSPPGSGPSPSPFSGSAPYAIPSSSTPGSGLGPSPSPFSGPSPYPNPPSSLPGLVPGPGPAPFGFFDHDVALAIDARIKQSQTDAQLAMDEAKKHLKDPNIASSETGKCLSKCIDKYGRSLDKLNHAITDLGVRDVTLLADDFGAVETDISTCQACFTENIGEDSPLKALEEATAKAARECLTVMDYAA